MSDEPTPETSREIAAAKAKRKAKTALFRELFAHLQGIIVFTILSALLLAFFYTAVVQSHG
jgi:hypothetical protein